jgi:hypothetical protein
MTLSIDEAQAGLEKFDICDASSVAGLMTSMRAAECAGRSRPPTRCSWWPGIVIPVIIRTITRKDGLGTPELAPQPAQEALGPVVTIEVFPRVRADRDVQPRAAAEGRLDHGVGDLGGIT